MLIPDEDLCFADGGQKVDIKEFTGRIEQFEDKKRQKVAQMKQEKEEKERDGCTFAPQLATKKKKKITEGRNLQ